MPKYINAEEAKQVLSHILYCDEITVDGIYIFCSRKDTDEIVNEMPSADVVEVVRCKDCKNSVCIGERYFCDIQYDEWGQPYVVKPDGYCDVGERRETNDE